MIPKSVISIGRGAFDYSYSLKDVYYGGSESDWANISIYNNKDDDYDNEPLLNATIHYNSYNSEPENHNITVVIPVTINVIINGKNIDFDQPPIMQNDRTLVPLRAIFEALGASVDWDDATETVTSKKDTTTLKITIGDNKLYKNGVAIELDVPAQIVNDRTLVPVRAVSEAFDCNVEWIDETKTVVITTPYILAAFTASDGKIGNQRLI